MYPLTALVFHEKVKLEVGSPVVHVSQKVSRLHEALHPGCDFIRVKLPGAVTASCAACTIEHTTVSSFETAPKLAESDVVPELLPPMLTECR